MNDIGSSEDQAGLFVCELLQGDLPDALEGLGSDITSEFEDDWDALTSFVEALPSLAPEIVSDVVNDVEDIASVVVELVTDPGGAITVIENGVVSVWNDITNWIGSVGCDIGIGNCPGNSLKASCSSVMAYATYTPPITAAASSTTAAPAAAATSIGAAQTTTFQAAASSTGQAAATSLQAAASTAQTSQFATPESAMAPTYTPWTWLNLLVIVAGIMALH
jgi:hypothetical protein